MDGSHNMSQKSGTQGLLGRCWPLLLGNVLEWYEFGVYGCLAQQISANFFGGSEIGTWLGFSIAFLMRPVGGIVFGCVADRFGRKTATFMSMGGMLIATIGQGLLPTKLCCGDSAGAVGFVLLLSLRALQGLCAGGELGPIVTYFAETSTPGFKALGTTLCLCTAVFAFFVSSGVVQLLLSFLGRDVMLAWGWRLPFLAALPPGLLALWGRSKLPETPEFLALKEAAQQSQQHDAVGSSGNGGTGDSKIASEAPVSIGLLWREYRHAILVGFFGCAAPCCAFYLGLWYSAHLVRQGMLQTEALWISTAMMLVISITSLVMAWICDRRLGSDPSLIMLFGAIALAITGLPVFAETSAHHSDFLVGLLCIGVLFGCAIGVSISQAYLYCTQLFPPRVRALGFGLTFNLAMSYFGGTASLVGQELEILVPFGPGIWVSALGLLSTSALLAGRRLRRAAGADATDGAKGAAAAAGGKTMMTTGAGSGAQKSASSSNNSTSLEGELSVPV